MRALTLHYIRSSLPCTMYGYHRQLRVTIVPEAVPRSLDTTAKQPFRVDPLRGRLRNLPTVVAYSGFRSDMGEDKPQRMESRRGTPMLAFHQAKTQRMESRASGWNRAGVPLCLRSTKQRFTQRRRTALESEPRTCGR
jgi:hypothetical protein